MTPKEKAEELVDKYKPFVYCFLGSGMLSNTLDEDVQNYSAKRCTLIAVDEILKVLPDIQELWDYWAEVKSEIEKL